MTIRSRDVERDFRSIVIQLVNSMPKDVLLRTSFTERGISTMVQATEEVRVKSKSSFTRKVQFTEAREEYEPSLNCSSGDETMPGESGTFEPVQDDLSGETMLKRPKDRILSGEPDSKRPRDKVLSGEWRNITDRPEHNDVESIGSSDDSRLQSWENTSETTSNSDVLEIAIHSLLVEWKQRRLDRDMHEDLDRDRYTSDEEGTVVDNAADESGIETLNQIAATWYARPYQSGTIYAGSNTFEVDMVRQVDGRCSCSGDNERAIKRDKDVSESQIPAVGSPKGSTK